MGCHGEGKTTLMECDMGKETTKSGRIEFAGDVEITKKKWKTAPASGLWPNGVGRQIFPLLTVEKNLRTGLTV